MAHEGGEMPIRQVAGYFKRESELGHMPSVDYERRRDEYKEKRIELEKEIRAAKRQLFHLRSARTKKNEAIIAKVNKLSKEAKVLKKEMKRLKRAHAEEEYERSKKAYEECRAKLRDVGPIRIGSTPQERELPALIKSKEAELSQLVREERLLVLKNQNALVPIEGYRFYSGKFYTTSMLTPHEYQDILDKQESEPVLVMTYGSDEDIAPATRWYMFKGKFYRENEGLSAMEVTALLVSREARRKRKIEKAMAYLEIHDRPTERATRREPIPDDVKLFVWKRDGGRCVKCGSREKLEFDHIIPLSKGGSNTARNIQLLCEKCNREKGGDLI